MKGIFKQYASYNLWANTQFADIIRSITPSYLDRDIESSFPSIRATLNHIRSAETIWATRLQGNPLTQWPAIDSAETPRAVADAIIEASKTLEKLVHQYTDEDLLKEFTYSTMNGSPQQDVLQDMLLHVFNHSSFHRGQLVTLFRQSGINTLPRTDYIAYARAQKEVLG